MKPSWGIGILLIILLTAAIALLGLTTIQGTVSLGLLLAGVWTVIAAFVIEERKDRTFYVGWGVVIAGLSLSYVAPLQYALALILIAIVILILVTVYFGRTPKVYTAATSSQSQTGGTPAAAP